MFAALTLDLKSSQKYAFEKRTAIQKYMINIVDILNRIFCAALIRDLRFNGGDELQGLFQDPRDAFLCLRLFQRALYNTPFHAGIGIGDWTTRIDDKDTFYQDGSAYHRARRAIDIAKKDKDYTAVICSETNRDPVLNAMLNSCIQLINKGTASQKALILLFECCYPLQSATHIDINAMDQFLDVASHSYTGSENYVLLESTESYNSFINNPIDIVPPNTESNTTSDTLIYQDAHPFGAATRLADITGSLRQHIDRAIYSSNIYTERALALALLSELRSFSSDIMPDKEA